jgi:VanZ family protein
VSVPAAPTNAASARKHRWLGPLLAIYWLLIFAATHLPQAALPPTQLGDKTEHFIAYGILSFIMMFWIKLTRPRMRGVAIVVLAVCTLYAAVDELTQPIVNRHCDVRDFLADSVGAGIGILISMLLLKRVRLAGR